MEDQSVVTILELEHRNIDQEFERVLGGSTDVAAFSTAIELLRRHIYAEEVLMFPQLRAAGLFGPIMVMEREHGEIWTILDGLNASLANESPLADLHKRLETLLALLSNHNAKEEPIVYPQVTALLSDDETAEAKEFLELGTMPEGWTPAMA